MKARFMQGFKSDESSPRGSKELPRANLNSTSNFNHVVKSMWREQ